MIYDNGISAAQMRPALQLPVSHKKSTAILCPFPGTRSLLGGVFGLFIAAPSRGTRLSQQQTIRFRWSALFCSSCRNSCPNGRPFGKFSPNSRRLDSGNRDDDLRDWNHPGASFQWTIAPLCWFQASILNEPERVFGTRKVPIGSGLAAARFSSQF
jgi:hypothetical protein